MGCALENRSREEAMVAVAVASRGIVIRGGSTTNFMPAALCAERNNVPTRVQKGNVQKICAGWILLYEPGEVCNGGTGCGRFNMERPLKANTGGIR